jgi:hypothetical protein
MGLSASAIDAWLRDGGLLVTASDRAARAIAASFHRARRAEGLTAWPAPHIQDWNTFVRTAWEERSRALEDPRLLLNPTQERAIWVEIAGAGQHMAATLEGPRHRLADLTIEAHQLLAAYAPRLLSGTARTAWQQDAAAFSAWLVRFDQACATGRLLSPARLPLELISLLESESGPRPPLLLAGFDRILPIQKAVFDAWGTWREADSAEPATSVSFYEAPNAQSELAACALWCARQLAVNPQARLLVVTQDLSQRRGEIERAFLNLVPGSSRSSPFEFSLGVPLSQIALARAANLLLRWLTLPIAEHELDWLFSSGYAATAAESSALQSAMRQIRRRNRQQPQWSLKAFTAAVQRIASQEEEGSPATSWLSRISEVQAELSDRARRIQSPFDWAELVPRLLESLQFAAANTLQSAEHQVFRRWQLAVESAGSLGFDGRRIAWADFLSILARTLDETLFAPESRDAPIQIAGPAESAGLTADAIWFLGASGLQAAQPIRCCHPKSSAKPECLTLRPSSTGIWPTPSLPASLPRRTRSASATPARTRPSNRAPRASSPSSPAPRCRSRLGSPRLPARRPSPSPLKTSAAFRSRQARSKAGPASSPPSPNAPSRPSPPPGSVPKPGNRPRPA